MAEETTISPQAATNTAPLPKPSVNAVQDAVSFLKSKTTLGEITPDNKSKEQKPEEAQAQESTEQKPEETQAQEQTPEVEKSPAEKRKESNIAFKARQRAKNIEAEAKAKEAKYQEQLTNYQNYINEINQNPSKYITEIAKKTGKTHRDVILDMVHELSGQKQQVSPELRPLYEELQSLKKEMQTEKQKYAEELEVANLNQVEAGWKQDFTSYIKDNADKYDLVSRDDPAKVLEEAKEIIYQAHKKTGIAPTYDEVLAYQQELREETLARLTGKAKPQISKTITNKQVAQSSDKKDLSKLSMDERAKEATEFLKSLKKN